MYDRATRHQALSLVDAGMSLNQVSHRTGISRAAIRAWTVRVEPLPGVSAECPVSDGRLTPEVPPSTYSYLLGLYLGDGCISHVGKGVHSMRIACADAWPGLIDSCAEALSGVMPTSKVGRTQCKGCTSVGSYSKHWPCLFPQHGPGPKHTRSIELTTWQQELVDTHPWPLLRGLIHSDGARVTNWTTRRLAAGVRRYDYPRYFFSNKSADIRRLYTATLDSLGVEWKQANALNVSVARRASVALMDEHIGAKY
ncbi:helix-turn-helix domain-containing protein [Streptacidiphilus carbonis]|uniref:helix-turn-helix domain-containing protein n=1 Tax=Streptacidiphilus carbonis TaxID=105422 RepID=UPI0005A7BEA9|nr:helix-turn-helix domain-containing protein [Streptacidiphilus carbonis]